jgi:hypothetical protein
MSDSIEDPVTSPETSTAPSSVESTPVASQAPESIGSDQPDPPPASVPDPATSEPADSDDEPVIASEEEILDRLQGKTPKQDPKSPETAADVEPPIAEDAQANPATPEAEKPFEFPDEKELAGYHSRTRDRMKQIIGKAKEAAPYANYGKAVLAEAEKFGVKVEQLNAWLELGFQVRAGNIKDTAPILANLLKTAGYKDAALAPEAELGIDTAAIEAAIDALHADADMTDGAALKLKAALKARAKAPEKPSEAKAAPEPARPQAPDLQAPIRAALSDINASRMEYAAELGPRWQQLEPQIRAEMTRLESTLPPDIRDNTKLWTSRYHRVVQSVLNRPVAKPPLTPSLRANSTPPAQKQLERGTPEYDEALLSGRIAVQR